MLYTLVQHSAFGRGHDPTPVERRKVVKAGGLLFTSCQAASEAVMETNYPPNDSGFLIPRVNGALSNLKVDGLAIYIPAEGDVIKDVR